MRVVVDTNTVVSGLLWHGPPRRVLDAAREGRIQLFTTAVLLAELEDILGREKFASRLHEAEVTVEDLVVGYAALATIVRPAPIDPVILDDPDDAVLACALSAQAEAVVSGDGHLLELEQHGDIPVTTAPRLLEQLEG